MLEAALWGLICGLALVLGAIIALRRAEPISDRAIAFVMAFGAGVLISAVSFDLTADALAVGGGDATAVGLAGGALVYFGGDRLLNRKHGRSDNGEDPGGIVLGALLDGIPESVAIGITLLAGGQVSTSFVVAVFLSNLPESISASTGLQRDGHRKAWIAGLWLAIAVASSIAAGLGYALLGDASENALATVSAFAAGAILCMLANTMMPKAFTEGGDKVGLVTVLGFALAALLAA
jgi:zinc transporter, ZIP family